MPKHTFVEQGREIARLVNESSQNIGTVAISVAGDTQSGRSHMMLLSAILNELQGLPAAIAKELRKQSKVQHNRDMALEREKQKTSEAVLRLKNS